MRTCWVLDHPAHVRLLAPFMRAGQSNDVIIATNRVEVKNLIDQGDGHIPRRQIHWVDRPVGQSKRQKALARLRSSHRFLAGCCNSSKPIERIVSIGAPIELMAWRSPFLKRKIKSISQRWYISDTEVNHLAHRLSKKDTTHYVLPTHWDTSLDDGFSNSIKGKIIHRLNGLHGHVHLRPSMRPTSVSDPPRIMARLLKGGGIHDEDEIIEIPESVFEGLLVSHADEDQYKGKAWLLDREAGAHDGVITQSVTFASEAALMGTPTLLVSRAKRGFLKRLEDEGYPIFHWQEKCEGDDWKNIQAQFLAGLHLTDAIETAIWPDARKQLADWLSIELID
ncbi:MAG: hypothetical protein QF479_04915 [Candidatus Poseidoniaceae archaeon]|nr:hypothetical protein [Candidatus Poseidoniaceae archaeon]